MDADEVPARTGTVRALIDAQFPKWRALPVRRLATAGTVNAVFRLGVEFSARFPRRPESPGVLRPRLLAEARAARRMAELATVPTPLPVAVGEPGEGFPMPWSVQTWLPGETADETDPGGSEPFATDLAELIGALRAADTRGEAFTGVGRGGDLHAHDAAVGEYLDRSGDLLDVPRLRRMWAAFRELPRTDPDVMAHGDLIPGNVLVRSTAAGVRMAGVLDTGGFAAADPALELVAAWHLLADGPRAVLRAALAVDDLQWERGRAWAFVQAVGLVEYYLRTNPVMSRLGSRTLGRLVAAG